MEKLLSIKNLKVNLENKTILNGINLEIEPGQIHAIMGPNGSGKTTLAHAIMGNPQYQIIDGKIFFNNEILNHLPTEKRAKQGVFLAFQYPYEIEGLTIKQLLRHAYNSIYQNTTKQLDLSEFIKHLENNKHLLNVPNHMLERSTNVGFSGGEKKLLEMLQLAVLEPKLAILDEIDSGVDVDVLKTICKNIKKIQSKNPEMSLLIITHYPRILNFLKPDFVHIMQNGKITQTGGFELAQNIEKHGFGK